MSGKRVLVTGATGFIGLHLVAALLESGHQVTAMVRRGSQVGELQRLKVRLVWADFHDMKTLESAVAGHEVVYHLAAVARAVRRSEFHRINQVGFGNLLAACASQRLAFTRRPKVVMVSSLAATGPCAQDWPHRETAAAMPVSMYGKSKWRSEQLARQFSSRLDISIVRPPVVLGPRDTRGLQLFKTVDALGVQFVPGKADQRYSIIHVVDLAKALITVANLGKSISTDNTAAGLYFAAADEIVTMTQLTSMIGAALGRHQTEVIRVPKVFLKAIGAANTVIGIASNRPRFLNHDKAKDMLSGSWACENQKLKSELGFSFPVSLNERIVQTIRWYRNEGWLSPKSGDLLEAASNKGMAEHSGRGMDGPTANVN